MTAYTSTGTHSPSPGTSICVQERQCRSILSPSRIPGADYSINPYIGCAHNCAYCYARYMQRYSGHSEPWGSFVDAKVNAPQILVRQIRRTPPNASLFMSSVTDPYQPVERQFTITRRILEILSSLPYPLGVHTKSALVERDISLLRRFRDISVTFTIVTGDERAASLLEPGASPVAERIRVLSELSRAGIVTSVFIAPIIPYITEMGIGDLLGRLASAGVRQIMLDDLHYLPRLQDRLFPALRAYDTGITERYRAIPKDYYQQIARIVLEFCSSHNIGCSVLF